MHVTSIKQPRASLAVRWMVVLCLALVAFGAGAQALHYHSDQSTDAANHCSLCLVMHSAPAVTHSAPVGFSFQTTAYLPASADVTGASSAASFALFSRPPPLA
jgi:hypothetical protein